MMLVKAGANPDINSCTESTALDDAAKHDHRDISGKPFLLGVGVSFPMVQPDGSNCIAWDVAPHQLGGKIVHELIQYRGIKECAVALNLAAKRQQGR